MSIVDSILHPAPPGTRRLCVMRDGHAVVRDWKIPKPVVLVDTREQQPYSFVQLHPNWISGLKFQTLKTGDYSVEGMESLLALERKSMTDAIQSTMSGRERFIRSCERLAKFRWKAILIEATYEEMKSYYRAQDEDLLTGCVRAGVRTWHVMEVIITELVGCSARRAVEPATGFALLQP